MHDLRLKIKLVLAITAMVMVSVLALAAMYFSTTVSQSITSVYKDGDFLAETIFTVARRSLETDLSHTGTDENDPQQVSQAIQKELQANVEVNSLLKAVVGYNLNILDAAITDTQGRALLRSTTEVRENPLQPRADFATVLHAGVWKQLRIIYGPGQTYDIRVPLVRGKMPFGEVRVGLSTVLLKSQINPVLHRMLLVSGLAILFSVVLAVVLSTRMLRPLKAISRRLDQISAGQMEPAGATGERSDEYGVVSNKIDHLGRQMRDAKEVFSALKENLDQMMANLQDGVMLFTTDFKAVLVSASAERFTGKPRGDMLGCHPRDIFSEDSRLGRAVLQAFQDRQPLQETEIELENGRRVQLSLDFIEDRGQRIAALLTLRDSESVHRIEDEIELSRRLSAIGRLTSGVAHEVKNPINAIVVHLEVLRQKLNTVEPGTRRHLDVIGSEIQRLDRVVQTLVDFTRPVELRLAELDLCKLVDEVIALAAPEAARHNVPIERVAVARTLVMRIDADLVKQAILNIVINGVQAMPEGGRLQVATRREGDVAVIEVRDQGAGIPAEIHDKIYNLYFTTKKDGSGIGLAMTYRVVQLHQGSVEFESEEGKGATFYLRFPLPESEPSGEPPGAPSEDSLRTA
ncbi:MAG TPA: ATP-binding protein [Candidatus Saccharimonadales bacterium]|jgi:signal transduction histidine kinase|nr:ATP-binding protein [Candidatus Saccharimonadales bacterium]